MRKFYGRRLLVGFALLLVDLVVLYISFGISFFIRDMFNPWFENDALWVASEPLMQLVLFFVPAAFFMLDLYPGYGLTGVRELERMEKGIALGFFLLAAISFLIKPFQEFSRSVLLIAWVISSVLMPMSHFLARNVMSTYSWYGIPVVIFGEGSWARQIQSLLVQVRRLGWRPDKMIAPPKTSPNDLESINGDILIFALSDDQQMEMYMRSLSRRFRRVVVFRQVENISSLWVEPRDLDGLLGLEFHYHLANIPAKILKRAIDIIVSIFLLILLSPFLSFIAIVLLVDLRGSVFFYQERLGYGFSKFNVIKFRTMILNAEQKLVELLESNPEIAGEYAKYHKIKNDPRITRVGKWLRRFSIDEIPQLINVLFGQMSLVGPRAYIPAEIEKMGSSAQIILGVKPGLTGWWQVTGRSQTTFEQRLKMDEYYIGNWSLWMDAYIMIKTIWVVINGTGA